MKKTLTVIILCFGLMGYSDAYAQGMLQIKGSDTLINLAQKLAEVYMQRNPGSQIAVTGGGSGTGIAALLNKKCDIANSSRLIKAKEIESASSKGIDVKRVVLAIDGLTIITNPNNPVTQLTVEEIGAMFRGDITNWSEVGGNNTPITLYGRQSNSGTYVFFQEEILKSDYSPKMNHMNGTAQIVEAVKQDVSGIGYVGVGYVKEATGINVVPVAAKKGGTYYSPLSTMDVKNGLYPISRPLNQYINGTAQGDVQKFLAFEVSPEGQRIVEEEGFFAIPDAYADLNSQAGI